MKTLPDKPSELIRVALRDLEACEKDPKYRIAMSIWHSGNCGTSERKCAVCMAGAVMAQTFNVSPERTTTPREGEKAGAWDEKTASKLRALDSFRLGFIEEGLMTMGLRNEDGAYLEWGDMGVCLYHHSPTVFKKDMERIASEFEKEGL